MPHGRLMLTVLGGLAEFERHRDRRRRTKGGFEQKLAVLGWVQAQADKRQQAEALARLAQGQTLVEVARSYNVSHMTISRLTGVTFIQ